MLPCSASATVTQRLQRLVSQCLLATVVVCRSSSEAFTLKPPPSTSNVARGNRLSASSNDEAGPVFYDDFETYDGGDGVRGDSGTGGVGNVQDRSRVAQARQAAAARDAQLARNWRTGNWSVRGFALDDGEDARVRVSAVAAPAASSSWWDDASPPPSDPRNVVAVGRTE